MLNFSLQHNSFRQWVLRWLLLSLLIWVLSLSSLLEDFSLQLYDRISQWSAPINQQSPQVLLVEGGEEAFQASNSEWQKLIKQFFELGATQLVLLEPPQNIDPAFYQEEPYRQKLIIGRYILFHENSLTDFVLEEISTATSHLSYGIISVGPSKHGTFRRQYSQIYLTNIDKEVPTVEVAALVNQGHPLPEFRDNNFLINFSYPLHKLPQIRLEQALTGNLIQEQIEGLTVLIAKRDDRVTTGVHTPITSYNSVMSQAAFHAYALNTLLSGEAIAEITPIGLLLIIAIASLMALLSYHRLPDQWSFAVALIGFLLYLVIGWLTFIFFNLSLPVVEAMSAHILGLTFMLHQRRNHIREKIIRLLRRLSGRLDEQYKTQGFFESPEHWSQIATLVSQIFNMRKVILLQRVPKDHRLQEIYSLNCTLDDIVEKRRDYERTPYLTAIEQNGPLRLDRPYLTPESDQEEIQYLVPLIFGGEVLGFWGFSLCDRDEENLIELERNLKLFAQQIAEMLHIRREWVKRSQQENQGVMAWLGREGGDMELVVDVQKSAILLDDRLSGMEEVFRGQETGTILYNLFGSILHINRRMSQLAELLQMPLFQMNAVDFIHHLTGHSLTECRDLLRRVILKQDNIFIPVSLKSLGDLAFVLQIRPLLRNEDQDNPQQTSPEVPFSVKGVLIELSDVSQIRRLQQAKELLMDNIFNTLRNDLNSVVLSVDMLTGMELSTEQRLEVVSLLKGKVNDTVESIEKTRLELQEENDIGGRELFPVCPLSALKQAVRNLEAEQALHRIAFEMHLPNVLSLVMAVSEKLPDLFEGVLLALNSDAAEGTPIHIDAEENGCQIILKFSNRGFGIPADRFIAYMQGDKEPSSSEFLRLRDVLRLINAWGGEATAESETGMGIRVTIKLNLFICQK